MTSAVHDHTDTLDSTKVHLVLYLIKVDAVVDGPGRLEILQHPLLQALWQMMDAYEVLEIFGFGVVLGPAGVHPLDNGCHITEDQRVHQCCR